MARKKHGRLVKLTQQEMKKRDEKRERTDRAHKIKRKNKKLPDDKQ